MEPSHLNRSLLSLRAICLNKVAGKDLIDNKEMLGLFQSTREAVRKYQMEHQIPEMEIVLNRMPDPKTFETRPFFFEAYRYVYEIVLLLLAMITAYYSPLIGIPAIILVVVLDIVVRIMMARRNSGIIDAFHQIASACSSIEMLVRNNESYNSDQNNKDRTK